MAPKKEYCYHSLSVNILQKQQNCVTKDMALIKLAQHADETPRQDLTKLLMYYPPLFTEYV